MPAASTSPDPEPPAATAAANESTVVADEGPSSSTIVAERQQQQRARFWSSSDDEASTMATSNGTAVTSPPPRFQRMAAASMTDASNTSAALPSSPEISPASAGAPVAGLLPLVRTPPPGGSSTDDSVPVPAISRSSSLAVTQTHIRRRVSLGPSTSDTPGAAVAAMARTAAPPPTSTTDDAVRGMPPLESTFGTMASSLLDENNDDDDEDDDLSPLARRVSLANSQQRLALSLSGLSFTASSFTGTPRSVLSPTRSGNRSASPASSGAPSPSAGNRSGGLSRNGSLRRTLPSLSDLNMRRRAGSIRSEASDDIECFTPQRASRRHMPPGSSLPRSPSNGATSSATASPIFSPGSQNPGAMPAPLSGFGGSATFARPPPGATPLGQTSPLAGPAVPTTRPPRALRSASPLLPPAAKSAQEPMTPQSAAPSRRPLLVLDLDHTLIVADQPGGVCVGDLKIRFKRRQLHIDLRPRLVDFLQRCAKHYRLAVFTAADRIYAERIVSRLQSLAGVAFEKVLSKDNCKVVQHLHAPQTPVPIAGSSLLDLLPQQHSSTPAGTGAAAAKSQARRVYVKELSAFDEPLSRVLMVDDKAAAFEDNRRNGIVIAPYRLPTPDDDELERVAKLLEAVAGSQFADVRDALEDEKRKIDEANRSAERDAPQTALIPGVFDGGRESVESQGRMGTSLGSIAVLNNASFEWPSTSASASAAAGPAGAAASTAAGTSRVPRMSYDDELFAGYKP